MNWPAGQLAPEQEKILKSMRAHWQGLTVFVEHPHVPMDNNAAERALRALAVARKNFYGSRSQWSGELAMGCFTILATLAAARDLSPALLPSVFGGLCAGGRQSSGQPGRVPALELERGKEGGLAHPGAGAVSTEAARRYCGREFSPAELDHIRELLELRPALGRVALSRRICQDLGWLNVLGQPKEMSCRVALLRMEKDGLIGLPAALEQRRARGSAG